MKAIYQQPTTDIYLVATTQMIAASDLIKNNSQNLGEAPTTDATSGNLSRRRSLWDEEEEEDELLY